MIHDAFIISKIVAIDSIHAFHADVAKDDTVSLSFSEALIAERLGPSSSSSFRDDGSSNVDDNNNGKTKKMVCNGLNPMDPLCAQLTIVGKATKIDSR